MARIPSRSLLAVASLPFLMAPALGQTVADADRKGHPGREAGPAHGRGQVAAGPAPAAQASTGALEQITVTANKRAEAARRVADSVTAITGRTLDQRQQVNLQDIAAEVPGLSLQTEQRSQVRIVLRGLNTGGYGATVASVLDEVPTNPVGAQNNASFNSPNFDTFDLSRIEVLRGPQSSLYGATAEAGIIKYVTVPPDLGHYAGDLESGFQGITGGGVGGTLKGWGNLPIIPDKLAVRVSVWSDWLPGYIDDAQIDKTDANAGKQYGYRISTLYKPTGDLSIRLLAQRQSLFTDNSDYLQVVGAAKDPLAPPANQLSIVDGLNNDSALRDTSQNETGVYYADVAQDFHGVTLTSITGYTFSDFNQFIDQSNVNAAPGVALGPYLGELVYGTPTVLSERENSNVGKFTEEVRLASDRGWSVFGRPLTWLTGFFFDHEDSALLEDFDARSAASPGVVLSSPERAGGVDVLADLTELAAFGSLDYTLLPRLDLELGGRLEGNTQHSQATYRAGVLATPTDTMEPAINSNEHAGLYSVAPRWRPTDDTMLYARVATGFRPGGPNTPLPGATGLPPTYGPDSVIDYEVGIRQDFLHKTVAFDLTGFWINWRDVQIPSIFQTAAGPEGANGNAGRARSRGIEWDVAWTPIHGLRIEAVGDLTDATLSNDAPGLGGQKGDDLPYVPKVSASVNVDYNWPLTRLVDAYASGTWSYTGTRFSDFVAPAGATLADHVSLPGYNTGALRFGLTEGRYNAELFISNIGDARGITYYAGAGGAGETGIVSVIQPRTIGIVTRIGF